jgi:formylmethanofuran dehydrogenase subunit E
MHLIEKAFAVALEAYKGKKIGNAPALLVKTKEMYQFTDLEGQVVSLLSSVFELSNMTPNELILYKGIPEQIVKRIKSEGGYCDNCGKFVGRRNINNSTAGRVCTECFYGNEGAYYV